MIRPLAPETDAIACDAIIGSLPEWFGMEEGVAEFAAAVRSRPVSARRRMARWLASWRWHGRIRRPAFYLAMGSVPVVELDLYPDNPIRPLAFPL